MKLKRIAVFILAAGMTASAFFMPDTVLPSIAFSASAAEVKPNAPVPQQKPGTYFCSGEKYITFTSGMDGKTWIWYSINGGPRRIYSDDLPVITQNSVIECYSETQTGANKYTQSETVKLEYKLKPRVTFSSEPKGGSTTVTAKCLVKGAKLYYTTDGSKPTTKSAVYKSPVKLKKGQKLNVLAVKKNWTDAEYTFDGKEQGFYHTDGQQIIGPDGKPFIIKGINFMNDTFIIGVPDLVLKLGKDHNEASYKEVASLGFNSVKLCLNYERFEDDSAPYKYKESGFDWLDNEIDQAKKYGLKVVLGNYVMPGGDQGRGLWKSAENQKRTVALMTELARRYADETAVIGYQLISEPSFEKGTAKSAADARKQCKKMMQRIADGIRKYDKNHILFVDNINSADLENGGFNKDSSDSLYTIDDNNTAYEIHIYTPGSFTHQGFFDNLRVSEPGIYDVYPSEQIRWDKFDWESKGNMPALETGSANKNGWVKAETDFIEKTNDYNIGELNLVASNFNGGTIWFDDITIDEYNSSGKKVRTVASFDFTDEKQHEYFIQWGEGGASHVSYDKKQGNSKNGSVYIKGTKGFVSASGFRFELKDGYKYKVSAYVKKENAGKNTWAVLGVNLYKGEGIYTTNKEYLEHVFSVYLDFSKKNNVPLYIGEYGLTDAALNKGGDKWFADMYDIIAKNKLSSNLHCYHGEYFGLYNGGSWQDLPSKKNKNTKLEAIIKKNLKKIK